MVLEALLPKEILPTGWLRKQLETQAEGLSGNLDKIWPDIRESKWLGGDREGWERLPYFLDGSFRSPIFWATRTKGARPKLHNLYFGRTGRRGALSPEKRYGRKKRGYLVAVSALEGFDRICRLFRGFPHRKRRSPRACLYRQIAFRRTLSNWAASRWYECLVSVLWLYKRGREEWLIRLADA